MDFQSKGGRETASGRRIETGPEGKMTDTQDSTPAAATPEYLSGLIDRLRGIYRIPIRDGLGPAGGEEPDNPNEFVRTFQTSPIQHEAATMLEILSQTFFCTASERGDGKPLTARDVEEAVEAEREACAQVADARSAQASRLSSDLHRKDGEFEQRAIEAAADDIAEGIRARFWSTTSDPTLRERGACAALCEGRAEALEQGSQGRKWSDPGRDYRRMAKEIRARGERSDAGAVEREACARHCEARAAYFDGAPGYRSLADAARSFRATAKEIYQRVAPSGDRG